MNRTGKHVAIVMALMPGVIQADGLYVAGTRALDEEPALLEYSLGGALRSEIPVVPPAGISEITPRDVAVDRLGTVHMMISHPWNIELKSNLSLCSYTASGWSQITVPNWSVNGVTYYGGIGANDDYIFCPDQDSGNDETTGILRFPVNNPSAYQHFPTGEFHTVTVGLNGLVYAADRNGNCWIFHPETMVRLADLGISKLRRGDSLIDLCVGPDGDIFTVDNGGDLNHFDPFGNFISEVLRVGPTGDVEVRRDGTLVVGLADQRVLVGTTAMTGFTVFPTNDVNDPGGFIRNHCCFSAYAALPTPVADLAEVTGLEVSQAGVEIRFRRQPGVTYELWSSGDGLSGWGKLPTEATGTGVNGVFAPGPPAGKPRDFFRIRSEFLNP